MVKNKNATLIVVSALAAALSFFVLCALWLRSYARDELYFVMPEGEEVSLEYGSGYVDEVRACIFIPILEKELSLPVSREGEVDMHSLGSYTLRYTANVLGHICTAERTIRVVDTTPPRISLKNQEAYQADWMEGYQEEGYEAYDACDGDLTAQVEVQKEEEHVVYTVKDSSGNIATASREIQYNGNKPVIRLNGGEHLVLCPLPWYQDPGFAATDVNGLDYSPYVKIQGQVNSAVPGDYELEYSLTNPRGESVTAVRRVTVCMSEAAGVAPAGEKIIYLTFDDGPGPYTDALLSLLDAYGAKATFFFTGNGQRYNDCIRKAYQAGHGIGVHTYCHNYGKIYASEESFFTDFLAMQQLIYAQTGEYARLYRFPGGSSNTVSRFNPGIISRLSGGLESMGYRYFDWNVNSGDADGANTAEKVAANIISGCAARQRSVVLQHDIKAFSVEAVETVLIWGKENGYQFCALNAASPTAHHAIAN